jgi:SAM-dependent methyltransferase
VVARFGSWLFDLLAEPATRGLELDDPQLTVRRRALAKSKKGLRLSYLAWYRHLEAANRDAPPGARVELGSGGGFLDERIDGLIKTDLLQLPFSDLVCTAEALPFADSSVGALFMVNVLHHVGRPTALLTEVERVLVPGGCLAMVEPFVTPLSRLIYRYLHPEPFEPHATTWNLPPAGPLSGGNDALPWIVFVRDRARFEQQFPGLELVSVRPHTLLVHLLSGGVMVRSLAPSWSFTSIQKLERALPEGALARVALFATLVIRRRDRG